MIPHRCHAVSCDALCRPALFMCAWHWARVPHETQRALLDAYRPAQEKRKEASPQWHAAAARAIAAVAAEEGKASTAAFWRRCAKQWEKKIAAPAGFP